jgi:hypothetical protein
MIGRLLLRGALRPTGLRALTTPKRAVPQLLIRAAVFNHAKGLILNKASQRSSLRSTAHQLRAIKLQNRAISNHAKGILSLGTASRLI